MSKAISDTCDSPLALSELMGEGALSVQRLHRQVIEQLTRRSKRKSFNSHLAGSVGSLAAVGETPRHLYKRAVRARSW